MLIKKIKINYLANEQAIIMVNPVHFLCMFEFDVPPTTLFM